MRWTPEDRQRAYAMRLNGMTYEAIGIEFNISASAAESMIRKLRELNNAPDSAAIRREARDATIFTDWVNPDVSIIDISRRTGLGRETIKNFARRHNLGPKPATRDWRLSDLPRPSKPSGRGGDYKGQRYEDDPRDPPTSTAPIQLQGGINGSVTGNAAAMCAG